MVEEWIRNHWPEGLVIATVAVLRWFGVREVKRLDALGVTVSAHGDRILVLETDRITRSDFEELRGSLTATVNLASERSDKKFDDLTRVILEKL